MRKDDQTTESDVGSFVGFILLDSVALDVNRLAEILREEWGVPIPKADVQQDKDTIVWEVDGMMAAVSLMPAPIPDGEAVENARSNYRWPEAVEVAENHKAHILIAVMRKDHSPLEAGKLFVKLCAACLRLPNAVAANTLGSVIAPDFYCDYAKYYMESDEFPLFNLVFFGLYSNDNGKTCCGYTFGMNAFGKKEIEVIDSQHGSRDMVGFLHDIASYVIKNDVTLNPGETIGFTENQKLPITESAGAAVDGVTLKISF